MEQTAYILQTVVKIAYKLLTLRLLIIYFLYTSKSVKYV